ncbi:MAG TPA: hypothetical protein VFN07_00945 [Trueperaceae bacterium]|nr:hypothetical protein [Trueperaceae bacterium]
MRTDCKSHPALGLLGPYGESASKSSALCLFPGRPKRVTDALHQLAETPGLTLEVYAREKQRILYQA